MDEDVLAAELWNRLPVDHRLLADDELAMAALFITNGIAKLEGDILRPATFDEQHQHQVEMKERG